MELYAAPTYIHIKENAVNLSATSQETEQWEPCLLSNNIKHIHDNE